ncbi:phosphoserine phosphatase SerB [Chitinasiproducens palmae]|uniref:Phosphoserine phosphatase n=1 Tax=Chitinasiproducens palmae TaxID=1770053 RepID=A0A1H2PW82_9BURK|nr:phosphoserine phosphatase SerB [Chitinasiproducens palmae]SDV51601.1 phosphoserine phosphatase [Chitinasiproducens palmae]
MNLVIQGVQPLAAAQIDSVRAALGHGAPAPETVDAHAVRFAFGETPPSEPVRTGLAQVCEAMSLDCAWLAPGRMADFAVLAMDMDSTLITIECIDEIADFCGVKDRVAAITEAAMRGEIKDFAESLTRRVALLEGLEATALEQVYLERLRLSPGAETLLARAREAGLKTLLVSGGFTFFTEKLQTRLGLDFTHANRLEVVDGKLTGRVDGPILDAAGKARELRLTCQRLGVPTARAIAIGDGSNDLAMMAEAGVSVAYHAKPKVREAASVALSHVGLDGVPRLFA